MKQYKHKQTGWIATQIKVNNNYYYSVQVSEMATENISKELIENTNDWELLDKSVNTKKLTSRTNEIETALEYREDVILATRTYGKYANKSLWLNTKIFNFEIVEDDMNAKVLLITKK